MPLLSVKVDDEVGENIVSHLVATIAHMYFSRISQSHCRIRFVSIGGRRKKNSTNGRRITLTKINIPFISHQCNGESQIVVKIAVVYFIDQLLQSMSNVQLVRQHSFPYVCTFSPPPPPLRRSHSRHTPARPGGGCNALIIVALIFKQL